MAPKLLIHAIVPLNVKATSLNCSIRLLNQPQSTSVYLHEITKRKFLVSNKTIGLGPYMQPKPLHVFPKIILKVLVPKNIEE